MSRRLLDYGDSAVLVECADLDDALGLKVRLDEQPLAGVSEVVPGARTLLLRLSAPLSAADRQLLATLPAAPGAQQAGAPVRVEVVYDGADLDEVAELAGLTTDEVVAAHTDQVWRVGFCGFAPGFAYLRGEHDRLRVPRRSSPRTRVPAGAVGLADEWSGVYPREGPGGWQLIGHTEQTLWDLAHDPPALLQPGMRVQFVRLELAVLRVDRPGPQALLQDLGRPGSAHLGVSPSGAADRGSLRLANRLVGNPEGAVGVECTLGGLVVTALDLAWVAVTGAPTEVLVNDVPTGSHATLVLRPGDRLAVAPPHQGLRSYLGVRGGIVAPQVLGSAATDVLSGLGPPPLQAGQELTIGRPRDELPDTDLAPVRPDDRTLAVSPGPRLDWFDASAWRQLLGQPWLVTPDCDRVAVRLAGPALQRSRAEELPSEGLVRGAVQVPASGQPLVFLSDHPVTGGYPVIAVLLERSCDRAAQLRPGDEVRFTTSRTPTTSRA